ncbi:LCP family protein [Microbacterium aoyamense]|uniref:LCP family protein n=1 Tax=Microbacterium aoyamense TaxID=344166 RepID=A0ABP5AXV5_9MICO|nr:LCP family protein [Microbacterium aoyamense]
MTSNDRSARTGRAPLARHGELPTRHPLRTIIAIFAVVASVVVISVTGVGAYAVWDAANAAVGKAVDIGEEGEVIPPSIGAIEGGVNVLVVGTDSCEGANAGISAACQNGDTEGERNDVTMLLHISDNPRRVTVVSFPRDMIVPIPACPREDGSGDYSAMSAQMLNASYMYGGLPCTVKTIEALTGENIQFAASIRWTGVINMSDAIGGVDVCVAEDVHDPHTTLTLAAGHHTLQGWTALQFLRMRHGIGDGSDLSRISNQQQFMSSLVRKLQSDSVLANPPVLFNLATAMLSQVSAGQLTLSQSLTNPTLMVQIAMAVKDVPYEDIVFIQYPTRYASGEGGTSSRVLPVTDAASVLFTALRENKALTLTGKASPGDGVEATGEVAAPVTTPAPSATPGETTAPVVPEERVELPSVITGTTAAAPTCTQAQK